MDSRNHESYADSLCVLFLILYLSGADCGGKCIGSSGGTGCGSFEGCSSGGGWLLKRMSLIVTT